MKPTFIKIGCVAIFFAVAGCSQKPSEPFSTPHATTYTIADSVHREDWDLRFQCYSRRAQDQFIGIELSTMGFSGGEQELAALGLTRAKVNSIRRPTQFERNTALASLIRNKKQFYGISICFLNTFGRWGSWS